MSKKAKITRKRLDVAEPEPDDDTVIARYAASQQFAAEDTPVDRPIGRPSTYRPEFARIARAFCAKGATDNELSDLFSVTTQQIRNWQHMHPEFGEAVRSGKSDVFDPIIERTLAQRAMGFWVDCEEVKVTKDGDIIRYPVRKYYPPDTTAMIFWLKNRQSKKWRDAWKIDHTHNLVYENMTSAELLAEIQKELTTLNLSPEQYKEVVGVAALPPPKTNGKANGTKH